jgi:hypothetical protein
MRWAVHVAHMGEKLNTCRVLVERYKLGRTRPRLEDNAENNLKEEIR